MKKGKMRGFLALLTLTALLLTAGSGCQKTGEDTAEKWEPGVEQFTHDGNTYSVVKQIQPDGRALTLTVGDWGVSMSIIDTETGEGTFADMPFEYIFQGKGEISLREVEDPALKEIYSDVIDKMNQVD